MAPVVLTEGVTLHQGDCLEIMATLADASVDAVVTDPPYGLEFMGREWDSFRSPSARIRRPSEQDRDSGRAHNGSTSLVARNAPEAYVAGQPFQEWCQQWAGECLRVLKPGGHLVAFGGTRTWHRLTCAIEDAGFEIRDSLHWIYGSGFPKSLDVSKAIDKVAGAVRAPGVKAASAGPGWRFGRAVTERVTGSPVTEDAAHWEGWGTALKPAHEPIVLARKPLAGTVAQNVLEHGTGALNVDGCRVPHDEPAGKPYFGLHGKRAGIMGETVERYRETDAANTAGRWPPNILLGPEAAEELDRQSGVIAAHDGNDYSGGAIHGTGAGATYLGSKPTGRHHGDSGGASRFFPVFRYQAKASSKERPRLPDGTAWPTVKPVALMRWLVRLVTPPDGLVLEPFAGTGTTGEACVLEGFPCLLIERDPTAIALIHERFRKPVQAQLPA